MTTTVHPANPPAHRPAVRRPGFTLGEVIVALLLFSVVGGGIMSVVMRQQRFYRSAAQIVKVQGQLRQGANVLSLDLRAVSTSDTLTNGGTTKYGADMYGKSDWHIEFRRVSGSSMVCRTRTAAPLDTVTILPKATDSTAALSSWGIAPIEGDSVLILDDGELLGAVDDRWVAYEVRALTAVKGIHGCPWKVEDANAAVAGNQPDSTPLLYAADTVRQSFKITLDRPLSATVSRGAPVRFFRRVRYEIYQAPDQQWYLGYSDCLRTYTTASRCTEVTPVSGPYDAYTAPGGANGLTFAYFDSLGNPLATTTQARHIARVDVVMRSATQGTVTRTGAGAGEVFRDSLLLSIGIRNRR